MQSLVGFALAAWLLLTYLTQVGEGGGMLLVIYWALNLPALGQEVALMARQYPAHRNVTLRLLEPLGAPEETHAQAPVPAVAADPARFPTAAPAGVAWLLSSTQTSRSTGCGVRSSLRRCAATSKHH
ncbi:MAG: hypothetical protein ACRERE_08680 [Candidatus Entotheonellia bacterium]